MQSEFGNYEETKIEGKTYDLKLFRRLLPFVAPYKKRFYLTIFLMVLIAILDLSIPYMTKIAIDRHIVPVNEASGSISKADGVIRMNADDGDAQEMARKWPAYIRLKEGGYEIDRSDLAQLPMADRIRLRTQDITGLYYLTGLMIVIILLLFIFNFFQKLVMEIAGQKIMHDLRMYLFNHIQASPVSFFNANPTGRLVTRITNDVQNLHDMFTSVILFLFKDIFLVVGIAVVLAVTSWRLALVTFMVLPFVIWASFYFAKHARDVFRDLRLKVSQINTRFSETIQGIRVIQLFRHEGLNEKRFRELNHDNYLAGMRQIHIYAVFMPVIEVLGSFALALIIYYGGSGVISDTITLGTLVAFISYIKMFFRPVRDLADKFNIIQNSMASAERIFMVLDQNREHAYAPGSEPEPVEPMPPIESVAFEDVSFAYTPGEPVLDGLTFQIKKGETLAVVGPTGAGKTSLIHLLTRFYEIDSGRFLLNGKAADALDRRTVRSRMALVTQDPFLFTGTVRENILATDGAESRLTPDEIIEAANCKGLIDRLPKGLDTRLSEGASNLSSGERQLISIARAIAKDPDLIILDEATSYIDTESEVKIQTALTNLMKDRTSVIIAHRLSTARHADTILVLNRGRIVESGNHEELMAEKGLYYKLETAHQE